MKSVILVKDLGYLKKGTRFVSENGKFRPAMGLPIKKNITFNVSFIEKFKNYFVVLK